MIRHDWTLYGGTRCNRCLQGRTALPRDRPCPGWHPTRLRERTRETVAYFAGGRVEISEPAHGPVVIRVFGTADRVSSPAHAGDGPIIIELRGVERT